MAWKGHVYTGPIQINSIDENYDPQNSDQLNINREIMKLLSSYDKTNVNKTKNEPTNVDQMRAIVKLNLKA